MLSHRAYRAKHCSLLVCVANTEVSVLLSGFALVRHELPTAALWWEMVPGRLAGQPTLINTLGVPSLGLPLHSNRGFHTCVRAGRKASRIFEPSGPEVESLCCPGRGAHCRDWPGQEGCGGGGSPGHGSPVHSGPRRTIQGDTGRGWEGLRARESECCVGHSPRSHPGKRRGAAFDWAYLAGAFRSHSSSCGPISIWQASGTF
jgi:hypothetical protein